MRNSFFAILAILIISSCNREKETAQTVIQKVKEAYDKHASISYKIHYRQKYFSDNDTIVVDASCKLIRELSDTLFSARVWFCTKDSVEKYYDLNNIYIVEHAAKKITKYKAHENQEFAIKGNTTGEVINVGFTNTQALPDAVNDSANKIQMLPDSVPGHFIVSISYPDDESFSKMKKMVWVKKDDFVIDKITYNVRFQGQWQYNEWNLSDIGFDNVKKEELDNSIKKISGIYKTEEYTPPTEADYALLKNGLPAPEFSGVNFQTGASVTLKDFKNKLLILDFSYMSCMPCIKAIPHLVGIVEQFGKKNVAVLAMNSKDGDEKGKQKLPEFISKNKMNYPLVLTGSRTDSAYNVKAYPSLYLIDKKGKILFSQLGFAENLGDTLKTIIEKELKK